MKFLKDIFTGIDNATYDFGRVWGGLILVWFCGTVTYTTILTRGEHFDPMTTGGALAAIMAGIGLHIAAKAGTEPPGIPDLVQVLVPVAVPIVPPAQLTPVVPFGQGGQ